MEALAHISIVALQMIQLSSGQSPNPQKLWDDKCTQL